MTIPVTNIVTAPDYRPVCSCGRIKNPYCKLDLETAHENGIRPDVDPSTIEDLKYYIGFICPKHVGKEMVGFRVEAGEETLKAVSGAARLRADLEKEGYRLPEDTDPDDVGGYAADPADPLDQDPDPDECVN